MMNTKQNYYGNLCSEMYEILHRDVPQDELAFYLSYAKNKKRIFEPLCGSGRFFVPFLERGFAISGIDLSSEMLHKLKQKVPHADVVLGDITAYSSTELFDYIFISSGSVSLFTDKHLCKSILQNLKKHLSSDGILVFAVDTIACRCKDDVEYAMSVSVKTKEGFDLILRTKNYFDESSQTQFSPGIYELFHGKELLQSEAMDFQTHLYQFGEMEKLLNEIGFTKIVTYSSFKKEIATSSLCEMFLYECSFKTE